MSLVDSRNFHYPGRSPNRKPVPKIVHPEQQQQPQPQAPPPEQSRRETSHSRSRTASSSVFPSTSETQTGYAASSQQQMNITSHQQPQMTRPPSQYKRTPSNATTVSNVSTNPNIPIRQNSGASLSRSTSSRSGNSPTSYVALMRRQKATVWSDRAQHEDPRVAKQRAVAKDRAKAEVSNVLGTRASTSGSSSSITGGVRSKIRHHGAPKARDFIQSGLPTSGVPMRLSQNEIEEGDSEDEHGPGGPGYGMHRRTDSGRSSVGSGGRLHSMYGMPHQAQGGPQLSPNSEAISPPPRGSSANAVRQGPYQPSSAEETPVPDDFRGQDYFAGAEAQARPQARSSGSSGNTEREEGFGEVGKLPQRARNVEEEEEARKIEAELRRRGSVDERTMTMSGFGKLFIANPDA